MQIQPFLFQVYNHLNGDLQSLLELDYEIKEMDRDGNHIISYEQLSEEVLVLSSIHF